MADSTVKVKALLGERFSQLLYFMEEGDVVLVKPRQLLSKDTLQALQQRIEEISGRYVNLNINYVITGVKAPQKRSQTCSKERRSL